MTTSNDFAHPNRFKSNVEKNVIVIAAFIRKVK